MKGLETFSQINTRLGQTKQVAVGNGRSLSLLDLGDPNGRPLFFFHGLPGSRVEALTLDSAARAAGYRIIAPDRPGFGLSSPQLGRSLLDWPPLVTALADALEIDRFGVLGISGGGPFALACAYAIPQRLDFVLDVAGSAPLWTDPAARQEISGIDRLFSTLGKYLPVWLMRLPYAYLAWRFRRMQAGAAFVKLMGDAISPPDRQIAIEEGLAPLLIRDTQEAFRQGTHAAAEETLLNYHAWGFELGDISMPVHILHGTEDKLVPFSFGEFKARHIPQARFTRVEGVGHFHWLYVPQAIFDSI